MSSCSSEGDVRNCARRHPPIEGAMTVKTKKIIMVELVETNVFSRRHCTVCDSPRF